MSNTSLFALKDNHARVLSRTSRKQDIQTFYNEHANAATRMRRFKWIIVGTLLVIGIAAWAEEINIQDANDRNRIDSAAHSSIREVNGNRVTDNAVTMFIDGPTGFVFVYTAEGWRFVPGTATKN